MTKDFENSVCRWVNENFQWLTKFNRKIWDLGETAWREYESANLYVKTLRKNGFEVEAGSGGMPTAFSAIWKNGSGPVLGSYSEYDAVPGACQAAETSKMPRPGLNQYAGGHTDPHSALGSSALGGVLAAKATMEKYNITGTLKFMGEPAEKLRGSKPIHAAKGYYNDLDAMVSFHPCYMLPLCNTVTWDTHCGAAFAMIYRFTCESPQTWTKHENPSPIPQAHSTVRAPGANDALVFMYNSSKSLRDSMLPHSGSWSMNEIILTSGQSTADNLPAKISEIQYIVRTSSIDEALQVSDVLDRNAEAAAFMTHCNVEKKWVSKSRPGLPNHTLARVAFDSLRKVGAPIWNEEASAVAQEIQKNLNLRPMQRPFLKECSQLIPPIKAEHILRQSLPPSQTHFTSDDYTEMCWHAPTARLYIARPMLKAPKNYTYPDWVMNALGGIEETINPMILCASKTIGLTLVRLMTSQSILHEAKEEFNFRTGGGINGNKWIPPLCDYAPPIHFCWPEYSTTNRGREWCVPTQGYT